MILIKRFIDKVSTIEGRQGKDFVIPMAEARGLRDEVTKLLADYYKISNTTEKEEPVIQVEIKGGSFR